eukprot:gene5762-9583_t
MEEDFIILITDSDEEVAEVKEEKKTKKTKKELPKKKKKKLTTTEHEQGLSGKLMPETKIHNFAYQKVNVIKWVGKHERINGIRHYKEVLIHDVHFKIGDFTYLFPPSAKEGDPFWVCQITELYMKNGTNYLKGKWFLRDTDIHEGDFTKYNVDPYQLYFEDNPAIDENPLFSVCGKAYVHFVKEKKEFRKFKDIDHFYCSKSYNYHTKSFGDLPETCFQKDEKPLEEKKYKGIIRALDLFSGCGGFSNGMEMNKNIKVKVAVDFFRSAIATYKRNHPHTKVVNDCVEKYLTRCKLLNAHRSRIEQKLKEANSENDLEYNSDDEEFEIQNNYDSEDEELIKHGVPESKDYLVQEIVDVRTSEKNSDKLDYLVKWEGWSAKYNEWVFEDDISCFELLYKFLQKHPKKDSIDFIFGGPPCQSFSCRNRYRSTDLSDKRNTLVFTFLKFVDYYKPKYFLIENVVGLLSVLDEIGAQIKSIGYQFKAGILSATHFQTPQKRNRVFIWGSKIGLELPEYPKNYNAAVPLKSTLDKEMYYTMHNPYIFQSGYLPPVTMWDILSDLPETNSQIRIHHYTKKPENIYQEYYRSNKDNDLVMNHNTRNVTPKFQKWISAVPKYDVKPGAFWEDIPKDLRNEIGEGYINYRNGRNMLKRLQYHLQCSTVLTSPQPMSECVIHPMQDRILSIRECARIQGFKDCFEFVGNDGDCYKQIGNAVAVPVAFHLGKTLVEVYFKSEETEDFKHQNEKFHIEISDIDSDSSPIIQPIEEMVEFEIPQKSSIQPLNTPVLLSELEPHIFDEFDDDIDLTLI